MTCKDTNKIKNALNLGMNIHTNGYIYIGYYKHCRKYGSLKCGSTANISSRLKQILNFTPVIKVQFEYISQPDLLKIESDIRSYMSGYFINYGNDHFAYEIKHKGTTIENIDLLKNKITSWISSSVYHLQLMHPTVEYNYTIHYTTL